MDADKMKKYGIKEGDDNLTQLDKVCASIHIPHATEKVWGEAEYMVNKKHPWNKGDKYKSFIKGEKTQTFPKIDKPVPPPSWEDIECCKEQSVINVEKDFKKLCKMDLTENKRSFAGNKMIYNYFNKEMIKTRYKGGQTLEEKWKADPQKFWESVCRMDRRKAMSPDASDVFELNRAITFFKPSNAKHIYQKYKATSVLDPCAGWGGRMLGAMAVGIPYHGFDTNTNLEQPYTRMRQAYYDWEGLTDATSGKNLTIGSCLDADFSKIEYNCVLTSPPYYDLEIYPHQAELGTEETWYKTFLMPMIARSYKYMATGGHCCINISPKMYEKLIGYGFPECCEKVDFLQQKNTSQWGEGQGKQDFIYVWKK